MDHGHTTPSPAYPGAPSPASASKPLQIIHLERRREDSLVVRNALEAEGLRCEILRVESRDEFLAAIKECRFDLVVADFFEPTLEGLELLRVVREIAPELLVIFFVADIKRELSDQAALAGAVGIVLKFDPVRLATAVLDALALNRVRAGQIFERVTLGDTELRLRKIAKSLGQAFWSVDARTGELLFANAEFKSLLGLPPHQLAQRRVKLVEFVHAEDRERVAQALGVEARTSEFQTEFRLAGADGETRWVWARMFPVLERGTLVRLAGTCEDITRRKTEETQLRRAVDRWSPVFQAFPDLFFLLEADGTILDYHAGDANDLLLRPGKLLGRRVQDVDPTGVGAQFAETLNRAQKSGATATFEYVLPVDGVLQHFEARCVPLPDARIAAFVRNITERKESEAAVRQNQRRIATLIDALPGIVFSCSNDAKSSLTYLSEGVFHLTGHRREEILRDGGALFRSLINPDDWAKAAAVIESSLAARQPYFVEYRIHTKAGRERWLWEKGRGIYDLAGELLGREGFISDITARRDAEEQLRESNHRLGSALKELKCTQQQIVQQERLHALGQMASGIAHDFNNTLMAILGFTELLLMHPETLDNKAKVVSYLKTMRTAAKDAADVVKRLNEFYRHREEGEIFPPVDITKLIQQVIALTQPKWKDQSLANGAQIEVRTDLQDVLPIPGHEAELRESLMNLIFNAVDAMPQGGTLTLAARMDGDAVVVEIADTGTGMTEEMKQRCFEPFFSTKGQRGTGLGLSMVFGIIQRHRGTIDLHSELGRGTRFSIKLPALKQTGNKGGDTEILGQPTRPLSVLVVDDEPLIRQILCEYLSTDGHTVVTADDGREGLQRFGETHFDLVLTDRSMPQMSGDHLADAIKKVDPTRPVVLLTGFGDMMKATGQKPQSVDVVMSKPVTLNGLRVSVAEAMGKN